MTANDHDGSTKSYAYTREHQVEVVQADFVPHGWPSSSNVTDITRPPALFTATTFESLKIEV